MLRNRNRKGKNSNDDSKAKPEDSELKTVRNSSNIEWISKFINEKLWESHSSTSLAFFRICWGIIMFYECTTWMRSDWSKLRYVLLLRCRFKYWGFDFIEPWPENWQYIELEAMAVLALFIAFGFQYRISCIFYFLMFSHLFLLEMTLYLNHYYLVVLISFLFIFLPANCCWSIDALYNPKIRRETIPYWPIFLLRTFIGIVYFYAGIAKINPDWLRGEPLLHWLPKREPYIGWLMVQPWVAYLFSYGGLFLDTFLPFSLSIKKIRPLAFLACFFFHITNKLVFNIGVFPWVMLASTTIFFETDWILWMYAIIRHRKYEKTIFPHKERKKLSWKKKLTLIFLGIFLLHQIIVPIRHWRYPGDVAWTEEAHQWSWRMKLRDKDGIAKFFVHNEKGISHQVDVRDFLTSKQYSKMECRPELIHQFAYFIANHVNRTVGFWPKVTAEVICSLNYRPYQHMVKRNFDLVSVPLWTWPAEWIIPLLPYGTTDHKWIVKDFVTPKRRKEAEISSIGDFSE